MRSIYIPLIALQLLFTLVRSSLSESFFLFLSVHLFCVSVSIAPFPLPSLYRIAIKLPQRRGSEYACSPQTTTWPTLRPGGEIAQPFIHPSRCSKIYEAIRGVADESTDDPKPPTYGRV